MNLSLRIFVNPGPGFNQDILISVEKLAHSMYTVYFKINKK